MTVAVGLSGGVDSSVVALLLKKKGYNVVGITMDLFGTDEGQDSDAQKIAEYLDIPFYKLDLKKEYQEKIGEYIKKDYSRGLTPNPCVKCNREIKFGLFLEKAKTLGIHFDKFATGHYAKIHYNKKTKRYSVYADLENPKDQSYFLAMLTQEQLSQTIFPLGKMKKEKVVKIAKKAGLFTSEKKESQDLCTGNYKNYFTNKTLPGNFIEITTGKKLGTHTGIQNFTIGQRRGLNIGYHHPLYVVKIDAKTNTVYVGKDEDLLNSTVQITDINYSSISKIEKGLTGIAKIRYRDKGSTATVIQTQKNTCTLQFKTQQRAITPGQLCVFYIKNKVAFSGFIKN